MKYLAIMILLASALLYAQDLPKICYLNPDSLLIKSEQYRAASRDYDKLQIGWKNDLELMIAEVKRLQGLVNAGDTTKATANRLKKKDEQFQQKRKDIFGQGGFADTKHAEMITPLIDKTQKIIESIAVTRDIDIIFDITTLEVLYMKEEIEPVDITDDVAKGVDKE